MGLFIPPYDSMGGILSLPCLLFLYDNGLLSRGFLHGSLATPQTGLLPLWGGIAQGWPKFGCQQGAVWWDMLLAEALVTFSNYHYHKQG